MPNRIQHIWTLWKWDLCMLTGGVLLFFQNNYAGILGGVALVFSGIKWWQQHKLIKLQQENEKLEAQIKKKELDNLK